MIRNQTEALVTYIAGSVGNIMLSGAQRNGRVVGFCVCMYRRVKAAGTSPCLCAIFVEKGNVLGAFTELLKAAS